MITQTQGIRRSHDALYSEMLSPYYVFTLTTSQKVHWLGQEKLLLISKF